LTNPLSVPNHKKPSLSCKILETTGIETVPNSGMMCSKRMYGFMDGKTRTGTRDRKNKRDNFFMTGQDKYIDCPKKSKHEKNGIFL
jgi:hypothetical protein